jgi:hypothetical protein
MRYAPSPARTFTCDSRTPTRYGPLQRLTWIAGETQMHHFDAVQIGRL